MSKDYAKRNASRKSRKIAKATAQAPKPSAIMWLIAIILIGLFVTGLIFLHKFNQRTLAHTVLAPLAKGHEVKKNPQVKFEFYSSLPANSESTVDKSPKTHEAPAIDLTHKQQPPKVITHHYLLQIASFKHYSDADDTKAKLLLAGFNADVTKVKINDTDWYRVYIGPYADLKNVEKAQQKLQDKHIQSLIMRQK